MSQPRNQIGASQLRSVIHYDPSSGVFTRLVDSSKGKTKAGDIAGATERNGYRAIWILGVKYLAHRLAWLYVTGEWPSGQVDHINRDRADNRIENLRVVSNAQNQHNRVVRKDSSSGVMGVRRNKKGWMAEIRAFGRRDYLGTFPSKQEASDAYKAAKARLHGGCYEP